MVQYALPLILTIILGATRTGAQSGKDVNSSWNSRERDTKDYFSVLSTLHPSEAIGPCQCLWCSKLPRIKCTNGLTLSSIQRALYQRTLKPILRLQIVKCHISELPSEAFQNLTVHRLTISDSNLGYVADDAFKGLENALGALELTDNKLYDVPTKSLQYMPNLTTLSLAGNMILKLEDTSFKELANLKYLILAGNKISTMETHTFSKLTRLHHLILHNNHINSLNGTLNYMENLEWLFLDNNRLTNLEGELKGLVNLKWLSLKNNLIQSIGNAFDDLHNLDKLYLDGNSIHLVGSSLQPLTRLRFLTLSMNLIHNLDEDSFHSLINLKELDLAGNKLSELSTDVLKDLNLLRLNLSGNTLNRVELSGLRQLASIDLSHNQLTSLKCVFHHDLSRLATLKLSDNKIEFLHGVLKPLKDLQELDISYNSVTGLERQDFGKNNKLRTIDITYNPLKCNSQLHFLVEELRTRNVDVIGEPPCKPKLFNKV